MKLKWFLVVAPALITTAVTCCVSCSKNGGENDKTIIGGSLLLVGSSTGVDAQSGTKVS